MDDGVHKNKNKVQGKGRRTKDKVQRIKDKVRRTKYEGQSTKYKVQRILSTYPLSPIPHPRAAGAT